MPLSDIPAPEARQRPMGPRRRFILTAPAVAALLGGCTDDSARNSATPLKASPSASPDAALRAEAGRDSLGLLAKYDVVIAAYPALADGLKPLRAEVARHAKAFGVATTAGPTPAPMPVPSTEKTALAALVSAEKSLADARTTTLLDAPPELARLLASVAAAGACHVLLLQEG